MTLWIQVKGQKGAMSSRREGPIRSQYYSAGDATDAGEVLFETVWATPLEARLFRRAARFWWTMPRLAALSRLEASRFNSTRAFALSPDATAACSFFCWRFKPVRTLLFLKVR